MTNYSPAWPDIGNDKYNTSRSDYTFGGINKEFQHDDPLISFAGVAYTYNPINYNYNINQDIIYIVLGTSNPGNPHDNTIRALQIDRNNPSTPVSTLWKVTFETYYSLKIAISPDGNYIGVGGRTSAANWMPTILNSTDGSIQFEKTQSYNRANKNQTIFFDNNNNLYLASREYALGPTDYIRLRKIDINGNYIWTKSFTVDIGTNLYFSSFIFDTQSETRLAYTAMSATNPNYGILAKIIASGGNDGDYAASVSGSNPLTLFSEGSGFRPTGLAMNDERLFITGIGGSDETDSNGLQMYDTFLELKDQHISSSQPLSYPSIASDGTIYYVADTSLYAIMTDGNTLTESWSYNFLPSGNHYATPIIDGDGRIIVCINADSNYQVYIFDPDGGTPYKINLTGGGNIKTTPTIGRSGLIYFSSSSPDLLFGYGTEETTTTTTTPTTTSSTTGTTSSTTTGTTTTTPTTTTTTTLGPLNSVITDFFEIKNDQILSTNTSNASDSDETISTPFASSMNFGTIAPGETSKTVITKLNIPHVKSIKNIKLGLTNSGGIVFNDNIFGITTSSELRNDIVPSNFFKGINKNNKENNSFNIEIPNKNNISSSYVYLNITLPEDYSIKSGVIKYKWFFDYEN